MANPNQGGQQGGQGGQAARVVATTSRTSSPVRAVVSRAAAVSARVAVVSSSRTRARAASRVAVRAAKADRTKTANARWSDTYSGKCVINLPRLRPGLLFPIRGQAGWQGPAQ